MGSLGGVAGKTSNNSTKHNTYHNSRNSKTSNNSHNKYPIILSGNGKGVLSQKLHVLDWAACWRKHPTS